MATIHHPSIWRSLRHTATLAAMVALGVIVTPLTQRLLIPSPVHAQASPGVVRASEFDLVGQNGTILARLQTGRAGNGNLLLFDSAGNQRVDLAGGGALQINDPDGVTLRFEAGYTTSTSPQGYPAVNGLRLNPSGTIGVLPASP